ncbi:MAG: terpene cyclase/mutase family protein [Phycisphaerales bacterium]|nr:terpene cyclase/mutase family protein [Phycisphaerales bacterium]
MKKVIVMGMRWRWVGGGLMIAVVGIMGGGIGGKVRAEETGEGTGGTGVILPKHVTVKTQAAIEKGLAWLAKEQDKDGSYTSKSDGRAYPYAMSALAGMAFLANGNTPSRGPYAENVSRIVEYLMSNPHPTGLITGPTQEQGYSMYGHGFSLLFLSSCYGMETDDRTRAKMKKFIENGIVLTGRAARNGGWYYTPGTGDEGSVTVTQMQGLRAARNAGFTVPKGIIEGAVTYLERCKTTEGGICYSLGSGDGAHLPISAAALATLYNAGEYDSKLAESCMAYVHKQFSIQKDPFSGVGGMGHDFYSNLYAAQAFYQAGDKYWDAYFPAARDSLLRMQNGDGSWQRDVGPVFATSVALIILQLPYKYLPIYQR